MTPVTIPFPTPIITDLQITPTYLRVYGVLAACAHTGDGTHASPPQRQIADAIGVHRRTIGRAIRRLQDRGYLLVNPLYLEDGTRRRNLYALAPVDAVIAAQESGRERPSLATPPPPSAGVIAPAQGCQVVGGRQ